MFGFTGSFEHNLDSKNRLFVPAKFREKLGDSFVIRVKPSRHPHIECFTEDEFEKRVERELSQATDEYTREKLLFASRSNANVVSVDSQGRISVNATILKYSCIEKTVRKLLFKGIRFCGLGKIRIQNHKIICIAQFRESASVSLSGCCFTHLTAPPVPVSERQARKLPACTAPRSARCRARRQHFP